jgi:hypothetical protein
MVASDIGGLQHGLRPPTLRILDRRESVTGHRLVTTLNASCRSTSAWCWWSSARSSSCWCCSSPWSSTLWTRLMTSSSSTGSRRFRPRRWKPTRCPRLVNAPQGGSGASLWAWPAAGRTGSGRRSHSVGSGPVLASTSAPEGHRPSAHRIAAAPPAVEAARIGRESRGARLPPAGPTGTGGSEVPLERSVPSTPR